MKIEKGNLVITVDGEVQSFDEEFMKKCIHDKLYNMDYRKKRNKKIAMLVKLGKEVVSNRS